MKIPEDLREFLYWVKDRTETLWQDEEFLTTPGIPDYEWLRNVKWQGLTPTPN